MRVGEMGSGVDATTTPHSSCCVNWQARAKGEHASASKYPFKSASARPPTPQAYLCQRQVRLVCQRRHHEPRPGALVLPAVVKGALRHARSHRRALGEKMTS